MSAGEAVGSAVFGWTREALGVTVNEMFGQTEMNYIVGNSQQRWPARPGCMGRPYPGHRVAVIDDDGREDAGRRGRRSRRAPARHPRPRPIRCSSSATGTTTRRRAGQVHRRLVPHRRPRALRRGRLSLVPGPRRRHVQGGGLSHRTARDRELPDQASGGRQRRGRAQARRRARRGRQGLRRARRRACAVERAARGTAGARARPARAVRVSEGDRVHRRSCR